MLCSLKHKSKNQIKQKYIVFEKLNKKDPHDRSGEIIGYKIAYVVLINSCCFPEC